MPNYKLIKERHDQNKLKVSPLFAVVVGLRGSGKTGTAGGTFAADKRVLLVNYTTESHSWDSVRGVATKAHGSADHITPYCVDRDDAGNQIYDCDLVYTRTLDVFTDPTTASMFDVIVVDGASALDPYVQNHSSVVKASQFDKGKMVLQLYRNLMSAAKTLHDQGKHIVFTLASSQQTTGEGTTQEVPKLRGAGAAEAIIGECGEVLNVQMITKEGADGNAVRRPVFIFNSHIVKSGKKITGMDKSEELDEKGKAKVDIQSVTQTSAYHPRISCMPIDAIPTMMNANMETLQALKVKYVSGLAKAATTPKAGK